MLLTCPACAAEYNVPDHVVDGAPLTVRCVRCDGEWVVGAAESATPPAPTIAPPPPRAEPQLPPLFRTPPEPLEHLRADIEHDSAIRRGLASWTISVVVVAAVAWAAVAWRHDVMANWPPSQRAYQAVGLH